MPEETDDSDGLYARIRAEGFTFAQVLEAMQGDWQNSDSEIIRRLKEAQFVFGFDPAGLIVDPQLFYGFKLRQTIIDRGGFMEPRLKVFAVTLDYTVGSEQWTVFNEIIWAVKNANCIDDLG